MTSMSSAVEPSEPSYRVVAIDKTRADELVALRKRCYALSKSFEWFDERALEWSEDDAASVVLGVLDAGGALVSADFLAVDRCFVAMRTPDRFLRRARARSQMRSV